MALDMSSQGRPTNGRVNWWRCYGHVVVANFLAGVSHGNLALDQQVNPKGVFMIPMEFIWNTAGESEGVVYDSNGANLESAAEVQGRVVHGPPCAQPIQGP
jgi:hypothetical protein